MLFNSDSFLFLFLPVTILGFYLLKKAGGAAFAQIWLTLASLLFYGLSGWRFVPLLLVSIAVNYLVGRGLAARAAAGARVNTLLAAGIGFDVLTLAYFKYAGFIAPNLEAMTGWHLGLGGIELPVGISFYTFTQIAFLVDAARGEAREYDLPRYALFVTFFPHLIAGPIIHHKEMMPQFAPAELARDKSADLPLALTLFAIGLAKKVLLADSFAGFASPIFETALHGTPLDLIASWTGALCYAFQIYFDFSGYSDMALGLALLFGIRLPVNFFSPYKAVSIIDFWRRWHMTLSRFLRDYLYFPLGGNRKGTVRRYANLMIVMVLGGLWHGAGWTFILWGALHGLYLMVNHFWRFLGEKGLAFRLSPRAAGIVTFIAVLIAWVPFRAENIQAAASFYRGMIGLNGASIAYDLLKFFHVNETVHILGFALSPLSFDQDQQWQALLLCILGGIIVWRFPNSMEIAGFAPWPSPPVLRTRFRFVPTRRFALATAFGLFLAVCGINAGAVSEFIYFKF